ncbi:MAG: 4,5-DOPA dioxygenase extradiol [candidate division FCPU426 bacterium]
MKRTKATIAFIGHGSPLNILANNKYTQDLRAWSRGLPRPEAVIVISAHWQTRGTFVSCQNQPRQVYDFYGFPEELYQVAYPCPGAPEWAKKIVKLLKAHKVECSEEWGIDHAAWAVLTHVFPHADIPVVEISLDMTQAPAYHYALGRALQPLKEEPCLIIGSGNMVHNLGDISWEEHSPEMPWARKLAFQLRTMITEHQHQALTTFPDSGLEARRGMPTLDHYLPMLYTLALQERESIAFIHQGLQNGSISMDSFYFKNE